MSDFPHFTTEQAESVKSTLHSVLSGQLDLISSGGHPIGLCYCILRYSKIDHIPADSIVEWVYGHMQVIGKSLGVTIQYHPFISPPGKLDAKRTKLAKRLIQDIDEHFPF
jgi:hypothetical protein